MLGGAQSGTQGVNPARRIRSRAANGIGTSALTIRDRGHGEKPTRRNAAVALPLPLVYHFTYPPAPHLGEVPVSAQWLPIRWDIHGRKHRPPPGVAWAALVRESGERGGVSVYHPNVSEAEQEALELLCATAGTLIREHNGKRTYWMRVGRVIGAADGDETEYLFVERLMSGTVHGRPMTAEGIRKKGGTP